MPRESTQEDGREAAFRTKRWLESSTYIDLPWNAYKTGAYCRIDCLDGAAKGFDLAGLFLDDQSQIFVENKGAGDAGDQLAEYTEFLAIAYSNAALGVNNKTDWKRTFIWVTTHPFGFSKDWAQLESPETIRAALVKYPSYLAGQQIDEDVLRSVASRIWLLILNPKMERVFLTPNEVLNVQALLKRRENGQ